MTPSGFMPERRSHRKAKADINVDIAFSARPLRGPRRPVTVSAGQPRFEVPGFPFTFSGADMGIEESYPVAPISDQKGVRYILPSVMVFVPGGAGCGVGSRFTPGVSRIVQDLLGHDR
jgi:hypothetical protein